MTPRQQAAFDRPVRLGIETVHPRYSERRYIGVHRVTIVLSLNTGYE